MQPLIFSLFLAQIFCSLREKEPSTTTLPLTCCGCCCFLFPNGFFSKKNKVAINSHYSFTGIIRAKNWKHPHFNALTKEEYAYINEYIKFKSSYIFSQNNTEEINVIRQQNDLGIISRVRDHSISDDDLILKIANFKETIKEFKILKHLSHHCFISQVHQIVIDHRGYGLILPYYPSIDFNLQNLPSKEECLLIFHFLFESLSYAHSRGIIHGDIKPSNIRYHSETKTFKLIDWDASKAFSRENAFPTRSIFGTLP